MALLQNAVKHIPQLSNVKTLDEYTSTTSGTGSFIQLTYTSYYDLLMNTCVRYDATNTSTPRGMYIQHTNVRKYLITTDAQSFWKEYSEYMTTASKGASEKRKLTQYVTNQRIMHMRNKLTLISLMMHLK